MIRTIATQQFAAEPYAVALVRFEFEANGIETYQYAWQVGGQGGPIYRDREAAQRCADRKRERDERIAAHRQAKVAAGRILATATVKAGRTAANRPARVREFGAGLGV